MNGVSTLSFNSTDLATHYQDQYHLDNVQSARQRWQWSDYQQNHSTTD